MKKIIFVVLLLFVGIFAGCTSVQGLYVDPSFTFGSMARDNIGVGGVVSAVHNMRPSQLTALSNLLQNAMVNQYPGMSVMPAGDTVRALGSSRYRAMMRYYQNNGVVPSQDLTALSRHVAHMRYLVFGRVEQDRILHRREQSDDPANSNATSSIDYITTLSLTVHVDVYDVRSRRIVWRGSFSDSTSRRNSYAVPSMASRRHEGFRREVARDLIGMAGSAIVQQSATYPTAPDFNSFIQNIFHRLIAKFPMPTKN